MISHPITLQPPATNGTGDVVVDVSQTPLAGVQPGTFVGVNPVAPVNATTFGLLVARVSAPNEITFTVKQLPPGTTVLVSIP